MSAHLYFVSVLHPLSQASLKSSPAIRRGVHPHGHLTEDWQMNGSTVHEQQSEAWPRNF